MKCSSFYKTGRSYINTVLNLLKNIQKLSVAQVRDTINYQLNILVFLILIVVKARKGGREHA
jgi:hypothetical protein